MKLYVNMATNRILEDSITNFNPPRFYVGDIVELDINACGVAGFDFVETDKISVAIGNLRKGEILAYVDTFYLDDNLNAVMLLNLKTQELLDAISKRKYIDTLFIEIQLTRDNTCVTIGQSPCIIFNNLISSSDVVDLTDLTAPDSIMLKTYDEQGVLTNSTIKIKVKVVDNIPTIFFE